MPALLFALLVLAVPAHAEAFRCEGRDGLRFQDRPCADGERQSVRALPAPPPAADTAAVAPARPMPRHPGPARNDGRRPVARSWECRAQTGEVFYRHGRCPARLPADRSRGERGAGTAVQALELERGEACRRMMRSPARRGRHLDERVSTYERNAGRDPCRRH